MSENKLKKQIILRMPKGSLSDQSLRRHHRSQIKHANKIGKRVCQTCGDSIEHQEAGEDTCNNCAK